MAVDIGIDLGTASVLVYVKGKGVVLKEPSVVAYDRETNEVKAIGEEARLMLGRTPGNIIAVRPLRHGVISDYTITEKMIKYFILKALGRRTFKKPRICICVPSGVTEVEKKAVEEYLRYVCGLDLGRVALVSLAFSAFIELGQLTGLFFLFRGSYRLCDVDDLMLNTLGGLLGGELVRALEAHLPPIDAFDRIPGSAGALPRLG